MKKLNAKNLMVLAAALLTLNISVPAFAAEVTAMEAHEIASKAVPASAEYIVTENDSDDKDYDVKFYDSKNNIAYEVEVQRLTGRIKEVNMEAKAAYGSNNVVLSAADAQEVVLREYPDAKFHKVKLEMDDGLYEYKLKFTTGELRGEVKLNPETGKVLEKDLNYFIK